MPLSEAQDVPGANLPSDPAAEPDAQEEDEDSEDDEDENPLDSSRVGLEEDVSPTNYQAQKTAAKTRIQALNGSIANISSGRLSMQWKVKPHHHIAMPPK